MNKHLAKLAASINDDEPAALTVRELLGLYNAMRRGRWVVEEIRSDLEEAGLSTKPDFETAFIDDAVILLRKPAWPPQHDAGEEAGAEAKTEVIASDTAELVDEVTILLRRDPTYRISKLESATQGVASVHPDASLAEAITIMMAQDFSQVPVMPNTREVTGVVSWRSIGTRLALNSGGKPANELTARDVMDEGHQIIQSDRSLFEAIPLILAHEFVLVRGHDRQITGLITANDLSVQFRTISEPFLLLSEIENLLREMLRDRFSVDDLISVRAPGDSDRKVDRVDDLTFGEYIRLLEEPKRWAQFQVAVDRVKFCGYLEDARRVRNEVMHFDPDGIAENDLASLRELTRFLKELEAVRPRDERRK